jgi:hypothetical protein
VSLNSCLFPSFSLSQSRAALSPCPSEPESQAPAGGPTVHLRVTVSVCCFVLSFINTTSLIGSRTEGDMHLCNGCAASRAWCGPSQRAWIRRYSGPVPQCRPAPVEQRAHTTLTLVRQQIRDAGSSRVATSSIRVVHNHASVISELLHAQRWCCAGLGCSSTLRH